MRPLIIMLMQLCNNWEIWIAPDSFGRLQQFRNLSDRDRAKYVATQLEPYLGGEEKEELPMTPEEEERYAAEPYRDPRVPSK